MENELTAQLTGLTQIYLPFDILYNLLFSILLGVLISFVYKKTHKGISYSQSFVITLVLVTVIIALVVMVIGNNIARAFALVGALSIIRFRTVVKDTKDTAFIFWALAVGMAAGTSNHFMASTGAVVISCLIYVMYLSNFGSIISSEFILRFRLDNSLETDQYLAIMDKHSKRSNLLQIEPSGDQKTTKLTYDIILKKTSSPDMLISDLRGNSAVSELVLVASEHDVDY